MKKHTILAALSILISFPLLSSDQEKTYKDALGHTLTLRSPPQRIVSLAPNITEILFSLGLDQSIVGVTRYCDYPVEARTKDRIGGMVDPNLEKIKALHPDLVIGFRGNPLRVLERIRSLRLPLFVLDMGNNLESVFSLIERIGAVTQREKEAEGVLANMRGKYSKIEKTLQNVSHRPKVFFSLHGLGLWTCGKGSFLDDLAQKAKGINIAGKVDRKWLHFNKEELIHENPEVIIVLARSQEEFRRSRQWLKREKSFAGIQAVAEDNIRFLDANMATRPGPRLVDALSELARILHPHCFEKQ
ncbi:MAG: ABC transporter substrate-binding protein [Candidatus Aminicenantales bacterium]